jgi:hypothetical protein
LEKINSYTIIIDFKGELTFRTIGQLITKLNSRKNHLKIETLILKKLNALIIEILENVHRYSDHYAGFIQKYPSYQPEFQLSRNGNLYVLKTSNPIRKNDIRKVRDKINLINNLNPEEMRILYRKILTNGRFTNKGGAGLGFFEMIKISGHTIDYRFDKLTNEFSNFEILLYLENNQKELS